MDMRSSFWSQISLVFYGSPFCHLYESGGWTSKMKVATVGSQLHAKAGLVDYDEPWWWSGHQWLFS
jgi:hypothetical protein